MKARLAVIGNCMFCPHKIKMDAYCTWKCTMKDRIIPDGGQIPEWCPLEVAK